ncbi:putative ABC transporter arginine-binding protein 2 [Nymphon striatum]|nr:putative ABC transporter arginine-binding protein 2 [Nymphon striatum]
MCLQAQELKIPNLWDKNERFTKPDLSTLPRMRFLTTTDFPPFNFIDRKKRLSGFHIDLARAICDELGVLNRCQIQALPWDELQPAMTKGEGDAIIAGLSITPENRKNLDFSRTYLNIPGRFITRKDSGLSPPVYDAIFKKKTAVVKDSAHAAYFAKIFANRSSEIYETKEAAFAALQKGEVETVFSDALSLSFWLSSSASKDCCVFLDEAFLSNHYFGNGLAVALPKEKPELVQAINYALNRINQSGKFTELYLRYFPLGLY